MDDFVSALAIKSLTLLQAEHARDIIDTSQPAAAQRVIPAVLEYLRTTPTSYDATSDIHKIRMVLFEVLHKFPLNSHVEPLASQIMGTVTAILPKENEEVGVLAVKLLLELNRFYKNLDEHTSAFLSFVSYVYANLQSTVDEMFVLSNVVATTNPPAPATTITTSSTNNVVEQETTMNSLLESSTSSSSTTTVAPAVTTTTGTSQTTVPVKRLNPCYKSFKVILECPIIVVILFQTYRSAVEGAIVSLIDIVVEALQVQPQAQRNAHANAAIQAQTDATGDGVFVGVAPEITDRQLYTDFIVCQVKTLSFLAYMVRGFAQGCNQHRAQIPYFVVRLLKDVPPESASTRKELLVATRHILSTDFRTQFVTVLDELLIEGVLIGEGITAREALRPLGFSMLADLIHHVRAELSPQLLAKTILVYARNLLDYRLQPNIQTMCAKLLLNLIETIHRMLDKQCARKFIMRILDVFTTKFESLAFALPTFIKSYERKRVVLDSRSTHVPDTAEEIDFDQSRPIPISPLQETDTTRTTGHPDTRFLIRHLVQALRTIITGLRLCNPPTVSPSLQQVAHGFNQEEVNTFIRLFRNVLKCFDYYIVDLLVNPPPPPVPNYSVHGISKSSVDIVLTRLGPNAKEEKEIIEHLSLIFIHVDPAVFQEVFMSSMGLLFERILVNTSLLAIPQYFLGNEVASQRFAGILLRFLVDKLDEFGGPDPLRSAVMLRLFKFVFMAITHFPDSNEAVLQPHVGHIITSCMKLSSKAKEPINYFLLLRVLFRNIGGGRFELLYKEVLPLLQILLEGLNSLLTTAHKPHMRELFVELCLTVPVRLSVLLPYLSYFMKPLVLALQAGPDLVSQGLRTLELCIDNLTQEFLDPIMAPVIDDLMKALWKHLRPLPYNQNHAHATMRVLGKLGGRNRKMLRDMPSMGHTTFSLDAEQQHHQERKSVVASEAALNVILPFNAAINNQEIALDDYVHLAIQVLQGDTYDPHYKQQAFSFIQACLTMMLRFDDLPENYVDKVGRHVMLKKTAVVHTDNEDTDTKMAVDDSPTVTTAEISLSSVSTVHRSSNGISGQKSGRSMVQRSGRFKKQAQEAILERILFAYFVASTVDSLTNVAQPALQQLVRHFALIQATEINSPASEAKDGLLDMQFVVDGQFGSDAFFDTVVNVMTSEMHQWKRVAEDAMVLFYQTCFTLLQDRDRVAQLRAFHYLASRFCSSCLQQQWYKKSGGCYGISVLTSRLELGRAWMLEHELEFVRSLLYILKNQSPELVTSNVEDATQTLSHVLKTCNRPEDVGEEQDTPRSNALIALLISELSSSNASVRETVQQSFQLLADLTGNEVTELLTPARDRLLAPIFAKPLRALPFAMQIGHIDAITYCLSLRPPLLTFNDELIRLLHEALALADAEDQALVVKTTQYKTASSLTNLRIVCIKLLSSAMACSEFQLPTQSGTRSRIISVFFKSLYNKSQEVVDAANKGLQQVLAQQHKLPKDLLQNGLRPILSTLAEHSKLTVAGLEGLARLLELLTNYFKVEIGNKLLDHMRAWADQRTLEEAAGKPLSENKELKIIVAIMDVFPLLPAAANMFLGDFVTETTRYESYLRRSASSPFRRPLIKFLNRYAEEAVNYFYDHLSQYNFSRLFLGLLKMDEAAVLRAEIMRAPEKLLSKTFQFEDGANDEMHLQGVLIVREICQQHTEWLVQNPAVLDHIRAAWRRCGLRPRDEAAMTVRSQECTHLLEILLAYVKCDPSNYAVLLEVLEVFSYRVIADLSFVRHFLIKELVINASDEQRRALLHYAIVILNVPDIRTITKAHYLRFVVIPSLTIAFARHPHMSSDMVLDTAMVEEIHTGVWGVLVASQPHSPFYDDLVVELMQLTSLIVQFRSTVVADARRNKDIIKFAWGFISLHDLTARQASYSLTARFIAVFDTPAKVTSQIFQALLKTQQTEVRHLVRHSLGLMMPVLPQRMSVTPDPQKGHWTAWLSKVISEEGSSVPQLVTVLQLLVRHPDVFYPYRSFFIPAAIRVLSKLGFHLNTSTIESRLLSIDLAELILQWEMQLNSDNEFGNIETDHNNENNNNKQPTETIVTKRIILSADNTASSMPPAKKMHMNDGSSVETEHEQTESSSEVAIAVSSLLHDDLKEELADYLVRFACSFSEMTSKRNAVTRCMGLLKKFLTLWRWVEFSYTNLEKALNQTTVSDEYASFMARALDILYIDMERLNTQQLLRKLPVLHQMIGRCLRYEQCMKIMPSLQPLLVAILKLPTTGDTEAIEATTTVFRRELMSIINDGLQAHTNVATALSVLEALSLVYPEELDAFIPAVVKAMQKLTRDHIQPLSSTLTDTAVVGATVVTPIVPGAPPVVASSISLQVHNDQALILTIKLLQLRIGQLSDHRRWLLAAFSTLIDKSTDLTLCRYILTIVSEWVRSPRSPYPTVKEKAQLLGKMVQFESKADLLLFEEYLMLVASIYSDPEFAQTELTHRLEHVFMMGMRNQNPAIRNRFIDIINATISNALYLRLHFVLGIQNWEYVAGYFWIHQALNLLLNAVEFDKTVDASRCGYNMQAVVQFTAESMETNNDEATSAGVVGDDVLMIIRSHCDLLQTSAKRNKFGNLVQPLQQLQHLEADVAAKTWSDLFPVCWKTLAHRDRAELTKPLISLLTKDYHLAQMSARPNVIQVLLAGIGKCNPLIKLPPQVVKYLGKTYNAWHVAVEILLQAMLGCKALYSTHTTKDEERYRESVCDAFCELIEQLGEEDVFYGVWRRRCQYPETNIAISYEQLGMWQQAQGMLEQAQIKGRTGTLPFNESEYCLWQDQWVVCSQKLQYWDILEDLARSEANSELALECAWRLKDWTATGRDKDDIETMLAAATELPSPRRKVLEAFVALNKLADQREVENKERTNELFQKICDEGVQLALRRWYTLPEVISGSHIPLLQLFQQFVELGEALQIYINLANTNAKTYDSRFAELKGILQTWRERLPNMWDDINVWSDLVAWRQHIFGAINRAYHPILSQPTQTSGGVVTPNNNTFAYRGYHETAWIVNRFAHVARFYKLTSVCMNYLPKIYTLPNIEIVEAFLKLKEQSKCYLENPAEHIIGLDVINNTNMMYFDNQQKAEFFALKGRFLAHLGSLDEANRAFATAVSTDVNLPKAWAAWGLYHDKNFKENPDNIQRGLHAINCYLHAVGLYKNARSRKYIARVLWLLSMDDGQGSLAKGFEAHKGEFAVWYWITFIPQLLTSLSASNPQPARTMLLKIAKMYPQALHYMLRTAKEDLAALWRQPQNASDAKPVKVEDDQLAKREPWEIVDEVMAMLKTGSPLLALSMETMVDQVIQRLKPLPEEEMYRYIVALLNDFVHQLLTRIIDPKDDLSLYVQSQASLRKFADNLPAKYKTTFEEDFITPELNLLEMVNTFRKWRDHLEIVLDNQPQHRHLEHLSHYLIEFEHQKFDDVEIPGQYLLSKDSNQDFTRIDRFQPDIERIRGDGNSYRRIVIRGHDGSLHPFRVQQPASRNYRREERVFQLFRMFNSILERKKETRKRNIQFHLPIIIPLVPTVRMIADDTSSTSLQDVYEDYCDCVGMYKDDPFILFIDRIRSIVTQNEMKERTEILNIKVDLLEEIRSKMVPEDLLYRYMSRHMPTFTDLWMLRKMFAMQMASVTFMTFVLNIGLRFPRSVHISKAKGSVWLSECLPAFAQPSLLLSNFESVPFRLTPTMQHFITPVHLDGLFSTTILAIAQGLTEPTAEMEDYLGVFLRDELVLWMMQTQRQPSDVNIKEKIALNVRTVISRAQMLACKQDKEKAFEAVTPLNQPILDLISQATNPQKLALMDITWMPFL